MLRSQEKYASLKRSLSLEEFKNGIKLTPILGANGKTQLHLVYTCLTCAHRYIDGDALKCQTYMDAMYDI